VLLKIVLFVESIDCLVFSGDAVSKPNKGRMRIHCLENVDKALGLLRDAYDVHLENLGAHDVVDGNARLTLGLIWTLILRFQIQGVRASDEPDGETSCVATVVQHTEASPRRATTAAREATDALLLWCQMKTAGYPNVR
jgi:spectrin beta